MVKDKDGKTTNQRFWRAALDNTKTDNLPGMHPVMQDMRAQTDNFDSDSFRGRGY